MTLLPPDVIAELDAIDATLAGEPVDPEYAEVAELALLLRAERPAPAPEFTVLLDEGFARRFAPDTRKRRAPARWLFAPAAGIAVALVVAIVVAVSTPSGGRPMPVHAAAGLPARTSSANAASTGAAARAVGPATPSANTLDALQPPSNGRKIVQSAQLSLSAPGSRIDDVAQEVFNVVGADRGYVNNSTVTATGNPNGYAEFQLTVPSANLPQAMTQLSELRYASVVSRTDTTNDITNQFDSAGAELSRAQALRTSLLKQLQNAVTQTQTDSIQAQLNDANARIASAQSTLRSLSHQVSYSQISLSVQARSAVPVHGSGGGFTLGKAAHDAGRVLTVAAGVALIALAVLVPLGLVGALAWWAWAAFRRHRREQALDLA
jgi:hypothetical protein